MSRVIAVFGSTGQQGGAVLRSLLQIGNYNLRAVTRSANSEKAKKLAGLNNVTVHEADLDNPASLEQVLQGAHGAFLVTDFSAHFDHREVKQGTSLIDAAIKNNVKHVVFSGLENCQSVINKPVLHFDYKAEIENYALRHADKINFTSIRLSAFYQELVGSLLYKVAPNTWAYTSPMADKPMYAINVDDIGGMAATVFAHPEEYKSKLLPVAGDLLKPNEIVDALNKNLAPNTFMYGNFTLEKFLSFGFPGVEEITNMFEYYQTGVMKRDINLAKQLNGRVTKFNDWLVANKDKILASLAEKENH
jgi:uncharacterized protein YbjT (DUF2867 family)